MTVIRASRHCFDDAMEFLEARVREDPTLARGSRLLLVHGIALAPVETSDETLTPGRPFAHAWVEESGRYAWNGGVLEGQRVYVRFPRRVLYEQLRIQSLTRYTLRQVWEHNSASGHFGPWKDDYRALCKDRTV